MILPTPTLLRERSELILALYPVADPPAEPDPLEVKIAEAAALVASLTGRDMGLEGTGLEPVPEWLEPLAVKAIGMFVEQFGLTSTSKARRSSITSRNLRSFTAGPYSESYFGPGEAASAKVLHPDPELNAILWALATEEKQAYWTALWSGVERPAARIVSPFYPQGYRGPSDPNLRDALGRY